MSKRTLTCSTIVTIWKQRPSPTVWRRSTTISPGAWNPRDDDLAGELGDTHATLQVRDEAIIIHLLETHKEEYLIGLEPDAARNLTTFLDQCLDHLE